MTIKSFPFIKYFLSSLLLSILFLNGCKKSTSDINPSLDDVCLIAKRSQFDAKGKLTNEDTYSYNNKRQVASIKHYSTGTDGTFIDNQVFEYNSDGMVIKEKSANTTVSYIYNNKLLVEETADVNGTIFSSRYSYKAASRKSKYIFKSTRDNKVSVNFEETYEYQDTLLIRTKNRSLIAARQSEDFDEEFKYDEKHRLIERKATRTNNVVYNTRKYQYDIDGNITKMIQKYGDSDSIQEELFTYLNNKLVEKIMSFTNKKGETDPIYKTVIEYKQDNISKKTHFGNGELTAYEQYTYTCDK